MYRVLDRCRPEAKIPTPGARRGVRRGCAHADWTVTKGGDGSFNASATRCLLCAVVKKTGGPSPCRIFCLDTIEAMALGLQPDARLEVLETLYEGNRCRVHVQCDGQVVRGCTD